MANRFTFPIETILDSNGDPVSGGKLNFYESGTTTRADTYSDNALSTANANPVVADSAGRFGDIFLQSIDYKVILTDANDVTIWTADPVAGTFITLGDKFVPSPSDPEAMTITLGAGTLYNPITKARASQSAQTSALIVAPSVNPRYDIVYVDQLTGAIGVATGTEAASPADPAIPIGKLPMARIRLATTTTFIGSDLIDDIREVEGLGDFGPEYIQGQSLTAFDDTGAADAYVITPVPAITDYAKYQRFVFKATNANTGASTLNVNSLGVKTIKKNGGADDLESSDIIASQIVEVEYDGTNFQMVSPVGLFRPPRGWIDGLILSNNGTDADHDIDIAAGEAADDTNSVSMRLSSSITKQIDATWAVGTNAGGLDTGSVAVSTWYHMWLIRRSDTGVVDALFSTSATAPTMPTNYDQKHRIGAVLTDGTSNIIPFVQRHDHFFWASPIIDFNEINATTAASKTLSTPLGVSTMALANINSSAAVAIYVSDLGVTDLAPSTGAASPLATMAISAAEGGKFVMVHTDTSSQIRIRSDGTTGNRRIATLGWVDPRGRNA